MVRSAVSWWILRLGLGNTALVAVLALAPVLAAATSLRSGSTRLDGAGTRLAAALPALARVQ